MGASVSAICSAVELGGMAAVLSAEVGASKVVLDVTGVYASPDVTSTEELSRLVSDE